MFGPVPIPAPVVGQELSPVTNPAPAQTEAVDSPQQPVGDRQPLELSVDKVDLSNEARGPRPRAEKDEKIPQTTEVPDAPNAGVTFRILKNLSNRIQSRVVDRHTREVIRSIPPDRLVDFYERFNEVGSHFDTEA